MMDLKDVQLIITDLDGTLLDSKKKLDSDIKKVLQNKKIFFTIATGRNYHIVNDIVKELDIHIPYIINNGANIYLEDKCIWQVYIEKNELKDVIHILQKEEIAFLLYSDNEIFTCGNIEKMSQFIQRLNGKCRILDIRESAFKKIFKIVLIDEQEFKMKNLCKNINKSKNIRCVQSEDNIYTITNIQATKGNAMKKILEWIEVDEKHTLVFGDNYNDISMFEKAKYSVAPANAQEIVKKKATFLMKSNDENGVSNFIEKYVFKS